MKWNRKSPSGSYHNAPSGLAYAWDLETWQVNLLQVSDRITPNYVSAGDTYSEGIEERSR
jgi:hypothetical protein